MIIKTKFDCTLVKVAEDGTKLAHFIASTQGSEENEAFAQDIPGGEVRIMLTPNTMAYDYFKEGEAYYFDIWDGKSDK